MNDTVSDSPPLDFLPLQNPASMRPFIEEVDGLLNLRFDMATVQSALRLSDPNALELEYTRTMMRCLLFCAVPQSILMIGMGGGSLAKYCHTTVPNADITVVEINLKAITQRDHIQVDFHNSDIGTGQSLMAIFRQRTATHANHENRLRRGAKNQAAHHHAGVLQLQRVRVAQAQRALHGGHVKAQNQIGRAHV